jgi:hypothetical protein
MEFSNTLLGSPLQAVTQGVAQAAFVAHFLSLPFPRLDHVL